MEIKLFSNLMIDFKVSDFIQIIVFYYGLQSFQLNFFYFNVNYLLSNLVTNFSVSNCVQIIDLLTIFVTNLEGS